MCVASDFRIVPLHKTRRLDTDLVVDTHGSDIVADDDTGLSLKDVSNRHCVMCSLDFESVGKERKKETGNRLGEPLFIYTLDKPPACKMLVNVNQY